MPAISITPEENYPGEDPQIVSKPTSTVRVRLALVALATSLSGSVAVAAPPPPGPMPVYLLNGSFDDPYPGTTAGDAVSTPAVCVGTTGMPSASAAWSTWLNTPLTQATSWIATSPDGYYTANLVYAGGFGDGLVQVLSQSPTEWVQVYDDTWTNANTVGVWVWVVAGRVGVQLGNGGAAGGPLHQSTTTGQWEWIGGCGRKDGLNNEITLYADGPAIFYVDDATIDHDPACGV